MALPTTRVLAVLDLLQSHGRLSGSELAHRVGVDVRTLRRYIVVLERLGIPITAERGRHGAYDLVAGFKLPPMMFTNDEAAALSVGLVAARGLGLADAAPAVESARAKLARVMPMASKRHVQAITDTVKIDLRAVTHTPESNAALLALTAAAQAQQRVLLGYDSARGEHTERRFDTYGLACRAGTWYAVGWCHLRGDLRSFRLDRVTTVAPLDEAFARPSGFDPIDALAHSIAALPRAHTIEVWLETDLRRAREAFPLAFGLLEPADGGVMLHTSADDLGWFARQLAALPFAYRILRPRELDAELLALSERLRALATAASARVAG